MKDKEKKIQIITLFLAILLSLARCSPAPQTTMDGSDWQDDWVKIGTVMGVDTPDALTLLDNKDVLAANGLYYASWVTGESVPYKNNDGDTIDLYDAQLYLLANESKDEESARDHCQTWLDSARDHYEILSEDTITCNGQSYTLISYNCVSEDNPYDRGISAMGVCKETAVCAELTCVEGYSEDLTQLLMEFLNNCHYTA